MKRRKYISELKGEHKRIEEIFRLLRKIIDEEHDPDSGAEMKALEELKEVLVTHVKNEDEHFYPALRQRAIELEQEALLPSIDLFSESMHRISKKVGSIIEQYSTEEYVLKDIEGFKVKLEDIMEIVEERMKSEEGSLFYIYQKYFPEEECEV
ncbi:MAG: hypothetical protein GQ522_02905 [Deltaproteobacteria bacterium]|nr:hypothetical protein [Deltaproteobacteria bacterium]